MFRYLNHLVKTAWWRALLRGSKLAGAQWPDVGNWAQGLMASQYPSEQGANRASRAIAVAEIEQPLVDGLWI